MNRREFTRATLSLGAGTLVAGRPATARAAETETPTHPLDRPERPVVAMLVHPGMVLLDMAGPQTVFALSMSDIHLVWKDLTPVRSDVGVMIAPTVSFADCPRDPDILFVPGGLRGALPFMEDDAVLGFLADRGARARFVTSVCTGSLLLGAAGLLNGYRAASHWYTRDLLPSLGATPVGDRVVIDRNRVTGGGVTAGIDFGLTLAARLRGKEHARRVQLLMEYAPQPPFSAGTPEEAGPATTAAVLERADPILAKARAAAERAGRRLGL